MNVSVSDLVVSVASEDDAAGMVEVIHAAFGARPRLDPPSTADQETPDTIRQALARGGGIVATVNGRPAGSIVLTPLTDRLLTFQRVSVHPDYQRHGIASAMVAAAEEYGAELGFERVELFARAELAELIVFWQHRGFVPARDEPHGVTLAKALPVAMLVPTAGAMHDLGVRLAALLAPGDVIIATGDLGAGKTTLTQGIGRGLGSSGPIISPTFVLSRIHASPDGRPDLVHVDAYRLSTGHELDDLDLDLTVPRAVTVVEWGEGLAEELAADRLHIAIRTLHAAADDSEASDVVRLVVIRPTGERWRDVDLHSLRTVAHA